MRSKLADKKYLIEQGLLDVSDDDADFDVIDDEPKILVDELDMANEYE